MPSFLARGIAHYLAASAMERRERRLSSYTPPSNSSSDEEKKLSAADLYSWQSQMRWLIPFVQATGYQIVIENPKSHEQIIIDRNTKELPELTLEWMQKYNKQELLDWMAKEKERQQQEEVEKQKMLEARRIEEVRGRERFGSSFTLDSKYIQEEKQKSQNNNKSKFVILILCIVVFIFALIGWFVYKSPEFMDERYEQDRQKYAKVMSEAEKSPITELVTPEGFRFDMNKSQVNKTMSKHKKFIENYTDQYYWLLGNVDYVGSKIDEEKFSDGKLCSYSITLNGTIVNGVSTQLTDSDIKNLCDYYKEFLRNDYTFKALQYMYSVSTYIIMKNNMAITIHYRNPHTSYSEIQIVCENRPKSVLVE